MSIFHNCFEVCHQLVEPAYPDLKHTEENLNTRGLEYQ